MGARIIGLDTIRFVCALWVVLGHAGLFPLPGGIEQPLQSAFNGPAAVIVFFVVSGLCIHYPFRHGERMWVPGFYARRYLRITAPLAAGLAFATAVGYPLSFFESTILWSLICEEIYYALYPLLTRIARRAGWTALLSAAYAGSAAVMLSNPSARDYPSFGFEFNWLLGLPCWLLGCVLAERMDSLATAAPPSRRAMWTWRAGVWFASWIFLLIRFHGPIGYPLLLTLFAPLVFFWLQREAVYLKAWHPPRATEWAGRWSYSLYLMHLPLMVLIGGLRPDASPLLNWVVLIAGALAGSCLFYLLIERPSHALARRIRMRARGTLGDPAQPSPAIG